MKVFLSPAKINIGLWIVGKRADGYHDIFTFMHTVNIFDKVYIKPSAKTSVKTSLSRTELEDERNIVYKAIVEFESFTGLRDDFEIFIEKNIPVGAGLGGGSSNAATVLKFLNEYFGSPLSDADLVEVAKRLGADVPFFLKGGFALAEGIGEKITPLENPERLEVFIIYPNVKSDTKTVYSNVKISQLTAMDKLVIIYNLQREYGLNKLLEVAENTLGDIAKDIYPQINEVVRFLEAAGHRAYISGSGSSVYCVGKPAENIRLACKSRGWKLIEARFV